jgi:hypothetical protein
MEGDSVMDIIKLLRESTTSDLDAFILGELAADTIEQLRLANTDLQMHYDYLKSEYDRMKLQLKIFQDDAMGDVKTIDNLSKMAARYRKGLDKIYNLHNSGDEYSEREINDMTYEIVVTAIAGTLYDKGPRLDDRGDNLDGN